MGDKWVHLNSGGGLCTTFDHTVEFAEPSERVARIENERQTKDTCKHCGEVVMRDQDHNDWYHTNPSRYGCSNEEDKQRFAKPAKGVAFVRNERP